MLDLLVFTQYPKVYAPKRLAEEARRLGLSIELINYDKVDIDNLPDAKYVILREPTSSKNIYDLRDVILGIYIKRESVILNKDSYLKWSVLDKITQHKEFKKADIPHIKELKLSTAEYPFVVKSKLGSHGSHVFKIESKNDLDNVLGRYDKKDLLFQEFQTSGFDLRVIVLDGRVLGIMKRTPKTGEFLSNFSQGGYVSKYEGDDVSGIEEVAIKTAKHFKLDFVGVDLMMGNSGEWKVLEVNRACQFKGFERALGINVALSILNYLIN